MSDNGLLVEQWLVRSGLAGGAVLLAGACALAAVRQPARRQRLGETALLCSLLVAGLCALPAWLPWAVPLWPAPEPCEPAQLAVVAVPVRAEVELAEEPPPVEPDGLVWFAQMEPFEVLGPAKPEAVAEVPAAAAAVPGPVPVVPAAGEEPPAPPAPAWSWLAWGGAAYLAVVGLLLVRCGLGYLALVWLWRSSHRAPRRALRMLAALSPRPVRLAVSPRLTTPVSFGLWRPTILLPPGFGDREHRDSLRLVLVHELTHLRRRDAWSGLLLALAQSVWFYLPWFWYLRRQVRLCQEYVADAAAAALSTAEDYAQYLVALSARTPRPALAGGVRAAGVLGSTSELFRRVTMLLNSPAPVETQCPRPWLAAAGGGFLALAVLAAGVPVQAQEKERREERTIEVQAKPAGEAQFYLKDVKADDGGVVVFKYPGGDEVKTGKTLTIVGRVQKTAPEEGVIVINVGSDKGLKKEHVLQVVRVEPEQKAIGTVRVVEVQPELALVRPVAPVQVRDVQLKDLVIHVESGPAVAGERAIWATRADEDKAKAKDDKDKEKTAKALEEAMRKLQDAAAKSDLPPEARKQLEEAQKRLAEVQKQTQAAMERARVEAERAAREGAAAQKEYAEAVRRARSVYVAGALGSGRLGIHLSPVSDVLAEHLGLGKGKGLVIEQVLADSAAAKAGLQPHDILLEFNGQEIGGDLGDFAKKYFADVKPGAAVDAVVLRKGKKVTVKGIVLTEAKEGKEDKDDKKYRFRVELDGKPTPKVQAVPGVPATPGIPATPVTPALPAMPPMPAMPRLAMGGHGNTVMTTVIRDSDRFTTRHQEGSLIITVTGTVGDGKAKIKEIVVQDGTREEKYDRASEVPDRYRDKVKNLVEMSEKGQVKVEVRGGKAKD